MAEKEPGLGVEEWHIGDEDHMVRVHAISFVDLEPVGIEGEIPAVGEPNSRLIELILGLGPTVIEKHMLMIPHQGDVPLGDHVPDEVEDLGGFRPTINKVSQKNSFLLGHFGE